MIERFERIINSDPKKTSNDIFNSEQVNVENRKYYCCQKMENNREMNLYIVDQIIDYLQNKLREWFDRNIIITY